jgi:vitamin K-dependent gamma-carboxylase
MRCAVTQKDRRMSRDLSITLLSQESHMREVIEAQSYEGQAAEPRPRGWPAAWIRYLLSPVDGASLAMFRICFGFLLLVEVARYFLFDWIARYYIEPKFFFSFLPFIRPWSGHGMYWHFGLLGICAALVSLGLFYRLAASMFFLGFVYVFLLDKTQYLNHFYLICLISVLLILTPAHHCWSLDRLRSPRRYSLTVPRWSVLLLRTQVALVYFFAGIAKLNPDWLRGEPQRWWLAGKKDFPVLGPWLTQEGVVMLVTYGGLMVDLTAGFLLLWQRTFWIGVALALMFNLGNAYLFSIGIFPFVMLATLGLFAPPDWPRRCLEAWRNRFPRFQMRSDTLWTILSRKAGWRHDFREAMIDGVIPRRTVSVGTLAVLAGLHAYLLLQLCLPLRHLLYSGSVNWTEEGHRFSWHMMLRHKEAQTTLQVVDPNTGLRQLVDLEKMLTARQLGKMASRPDMIQQLAHHIADQYQRTNGVRPRVHALAVASLNGRPWQELIDPAVDLASQPITLRFKPWIVPLRPLILDSQR